MRYLSMSARVPGREPDDVYRIVSDYERYPEHSSAVRRITVTAEDGSRAMSDWEVNFRKGIMRWTEEDIFDASTRTIRFQQTEGDPEHFAGRWNVEPQDGGSVVNLEVEFDLGIPGLSHIIDRIAEQAVYENFQMILQGILGQSLADTTFRSSSRRP